MVVGVIVVLLVVVVVIKEVLVKVSASDCDGRDGGGIHYKL